ncbi:universal stress protein UspA-like protein [Xenococcus sp. PCC 7305]|uniref:universal stress protein n=1 Tax=Xenococcus sp. PCC 7305 TaxID=102125 RepID=UPI0002AD0C2D|nr:universal stress protein [Xenococcus sp. PCC 7305]ELS04875.1 universal stress protein UspA-like protein [Xenococcus sp. PCC 7305]
MFKSCLICTDFSDGLHRLVNFVPDLAAAGLETITFFNSVPLWEEGEVPRIDEENIQAAEQRFQKALSYVPEGVEVNIEVASGKPLDTIPKIIKNKSVDVILTGSSIQNSLQERFFGNTSVGLSKLTNKPLTVIRPQLITTYTREELSLRCRHLWQYLLVPYNDSESGRYLIEQIKQRVASCPDSSLKKCMLITVVDDSGRQAMFKDVRVTEAADKLESVKKELEDLGIEVNTEVRTGNPLHEIMDAALEFDISAIAIATDYRNTLLQWTAPSFANNLIRSSWFPILFFSPKK